MKTNKIITLTVAIVLSSLASINLANADSYIPGQLCNPANLTQAINRDLGWDQVGTNNNHDTLSFYVVCPIMTSDDSFTDNTLRVGAKIPDPEGKIDCILRSLRVQSINLVEFRSFDIDSNPLFHPYAEAIVDSVGNLHRESANSNIVCLLDPGEAIVQYYIYTSSPN